LAEAILDHPHDLIHKATGWMLREVGKQQLSVLEQFLHQHAPHMPRTMLRYAIEKMPLAQRQAFLQMRA
ncbi:MAG: DNA alkylation repair protein, partial [Shimia sp.]|nr:DNA alkylation repair protein [Shimia sp.]